MSKYQFLILITRLNDLISSLFLFISFIFKVVSFVDLFDPTI